MIVSKINTMCQSNSLIFVGKHHLHVINCSPAVQFYYIASCPDPPSLSTYEQEKKGGGRLVRKIMYTMC